MKICFFSGDITRSGGTERVSLIIANELARRKNCQVVFLSLVEQKDAPFYEMDQSIKRFALGRKWLSPGPAYLPLIPKLRRFLKKEEIDVIIDIDIVLDVLSVPASAFLKTRVISWEHSNLQYEMGITYRRMILNLFTARTDWIVTLTPGDAKSFQKKMHRSERITSIYNPVTMLPKTDGIRRENALITVGRLVPEKGTDLLVQIALKVLPTHPTWKWHICGDGPERSKLEQFRTEHGLESQLLLNGLVPNVEEYLKESKLFVLTSLAEGLPMCLLEARTCGVPCVSFDIPTGPADIIQDGENGYLIEPFDVDLMADKINCLLEDEGRLEEMGKKAARDLEPFRLEVVIQAWEELINQLLER